MTRRSPLDLRRAKAWGFLPGVNAELGVIGESLAYFWSQPLIGSTGDVLFQATPGSQGSQPVAVPCWEKDNAGVAFPAGVVLALAGVDSISFSWQTLIADGVEIGDQFEENSVLTRSHRGRYLFVVGAVPGSSCTLLVRRYGYWRNNTVGSPTTVETITIDGDDGTVQVIALDDLEAPDDAAECYGVYYLATWTGTPPHRMWLARAPRTTHGAMVVPTEIPSGYTATEDAGESFRTYGLTRQVSGRDGASAYALGGYPTLCGPLMRVMTDNGWRTAYTPGNDTREPRRALGLPDTVRYADKSTASSPLLYPDISPPRIWVANALREMTYWPIARGPQVGVTQPSVSAFGFEETVDLDSGWVNFNSSGASTTNSVGPGWRNLRVYVLERTIGSSATIDSLTLEWRINGGTASSADISALDGDGSVADFLDITTDLTPSSPDFDAFLEVRVTGQATFGSTSASVSVDLRIYASPRVDIPCPWTMPGRGVDTAPGAYLTGSLTDPVSFGGVLHVDEGDTSSSWTIAATVSGETQCRVISFVPPSIGYWRIKPPGTFNCTLGEYQDRITGAPGEIGRPGKRFFGRALSATLSQINGTWTLEAVAPTYHAIADTGTQVTASLLTPLTTGMFFGTIALPGAGTYRVRTRCTTAPSGLSYRIFLSLTDAFCAVPALADAQVDIATVLGSTDFTSATEPPASPTTGMARWIVAPATGAWAGREGQLAYRLDERWVYLDLAAQPRQVGVIDGTWSISAGATWSTLDDADLTSQTVTVDAAATLYVRMVRADDEFTGTPLPPIGGPTIYWEAV